MARFTFWCWVLLMAGCTTDLSVSIGPQPKAMCPEFRPPVREIVPRELDLDLLPYNDAELVAETLGKENRDLRDYIKRRDQRDQEAYYDYLQSCRQTGKTLRPTPN